MTTLKQGTTTLTPYAVGAFTYTRNSRHVIHDVIGTATPDVSLRPASLRTGTVRFLCATMAQSLAVETMHAAAGTILLEDTDVPELNMTYVASGTITNEPDDTTGMRLVSADFTQVG